VNKAKPFCISKWEVWEAYKRVKANQGAAGVDGQSIADFEVDLKNNLFKIWNRMSSGSYFPPPVRRVDIPKDNGRMRPLGIPTVADRIAQTVVKRYLEPILEEYFHPDSYGYRPEKSAIEALRVARQRCWKYDWVLDLDIKGFFDSIDWRLLLQAVRKHTDCKWVLLYIERWLKAPVQMEDGSLSHRERGTPQGGVISPLLANLYLHWFDTVFHRSSGPAHWAQAKLVRYADDFVVLARYQGSQLREFIESKLETWMGLEINRDKTRVVDLKQEGASLDFLGFTFRFDRDRKGRGHRYLNVFPSKKALQRERAKLRELTSGRRCFYPIPMLIEDLNGHLNGWANYFRFGYSRVAFRQINTYVRDRLTQHLKRRSQRPFHPPEGVTYYQQLQRLGLVYL